MIITRCFSYVMCHYDLCMTFLGNEVLSPKHSSPALTLLPFYTSTTCTFSKHVKATRSSMGNNWKPVTDVNDAEFMQCYYICKHFQK